MCVTVNKVTYFEMEKVYCCFCCCCGGVVIVAIGGGAAVGAGATRILYLSNNLY